MRPVPSPPYETVAALAAEVAKLRTLEVQVADVRADARFAKAAIGRAGLGLGADMRAKTSAAPCSRRLAGDDGVISSRRVGG